MALSYSLGSLFGGDEGNTFDFAPDYSSFSPTLSPPDWSQYAQDPSLYQDYVGGTPEPQTVPAAMGIQDPANATGGGARTPPSIYEKLLMGGLGAAPGLLGMLGTLMGNGGFSPGQSGPARANALQQQGSQALQYMQPGANSLFNSGAGLLGQLGGMTNPLQQQQQSILAALAPQAANMASGNMQIPPALQALVKRAYDPYVGDIAEQAINSARNRGFAGGAELLQQGPAGAIAGPALARASGMQAQSLLDAMLKFPQGAAQIAGSYNQPINQLTNIATQSMAPQQQQATGYDSMLRSLSYNRASQQNVGQTLGQQAGQALTGGLGGYALPGQQAQQQNQFNSLLNALQGSGQSAGGMSGIYT